MRIGLFFCLLLLVGCKKAIKNEGKVAGYEPEIIDFKVPEVSDRLIMKSKEDLLGYWVGRFELDLTEKEVDSLFDNDEMGIEELAKKITVSIDEIVGDQVKGHTVVSGTISSFEGKLVESQSQFLLDLKETSNLRTDGVFKMAIQKNDSLIKGKWEVLQKDAVAYGKKKFELQKRLFRYDPSIELNEIFRNTDKSKHIIVRDTIDEEEINEYETNEYFSTTEKIFDKNASKEVLDKEFVANLTKADIFILRNSIFARHGFAFRDKQLRMYFENFYWYMPVFSDVKNELTEIEKKNIELLLRYEQNAVEYYDVFGR